MEDDATLSSFNEMSGVQRSHRSAGYTAFGAKRSPRHMASVWVERLYALQMMAVVDVGVGVEVAVGVEELREPRICGITTKPAERAAAFHPFHWTFDWTHPLSTVLQQTILYRAQWKWLRFNCLIWTLRPLSKVLQQKDFLLCAGIV